MSEYQVIARKWRPRHFSDVVGQQHVVQTLKNAIIRNRTAHAYLFVGPRGIGKTTLARIFAKALNCLNPKDGEPCCECENCRAAAEERSLDIIEIDAASRNSADAMRELAEEVMPSPVGGRYKIYIIDEVHMLSKQAWNVLLKTVEEPPEHVKFIFATTEVHQVLPTIISRCQRFDLQPIPTKLIAERLKLIVDTEKVAVEPAALDAIARAAEGGMRDAQSLLDQMIAFFLRDGGAAITGEQVLSLFGLTDRSELDSIISAMLKNEPAGALMTIARLTKRGKNLETLFDELLESLRAVELCSILPDPGAVLDETPESIADYRKLAALTDPESLQIILENLAPVGRSLRDALNKQIMLETVILKAMREAHAVRISDILRRLNQLRTAGELKFIDQLPPAVRAPQIVLPPPVEEKKTELPPPPPAPVISQPEPEAEIPASVPVAEEKPKVEIPAPAPVAEEKTIEAPIPVTEEKPVEIPASAPAVEQKPVETPASAPAVEQKPVGTPAAEEEISVECEAAPAPAPAAEIPADENHPDQMADHKTRHSVINTDPDALHRVLKEDPVIAEAVKLFRGSIIDMHVK